MSWWKKSNDVAKFDIADRTVPGIPDVFTGRDTTYGALRQMSIEVKDETATTGVERGLAITLLAVIADFEQHLSEDTND